MKNSMEKIYMNEIKCPHCNTAFTINESDYSNLLNQIRTKEFDKEIESRLENERKVADAELHRQLEKVQSRSDLLLSQKLSEKDKEIERLSLEIKSATDLFESKKDTALSQLTIEFDAKLAQKESEIKDLKSANDLSEVKIEQKYLDQLTEKDNRLKLLEEQIASFNSSKQTIIDAEVLKVESNYESQLKNKELEIQRLESAKTLLEQQLEQKYGQRILELESKLTIYDTQKDSEITKMKSEYEYKLLALESDKSSEVARLHDQYQGQLKAAEEQVEFYKDFKARQSTKAIGESLEQYAETEFNKVRSIAFPNADFAKDNVVSKTGSKGDFIFRDRVDGLEFISIMFEMKNEADTTKTKHRNSDFYKELDRDRREKDCEYAVLVSMLESDNDYFNTGIVDVSAESGYEKMYVIRPQFFIQMIGILRNAALNSVGYQKQLLEISNQNIDVTNFEKDLDDFKNIFAKHYNNASNRFDDAIKAIDKSISEMEKIRDALTKSSDHLRKANDRLDDVTIQRLTKNNPTMQRKFGLIE